MIKILSNRVIRELKSNILRYLSLGLLVILCVYTVVSLVGASETVIVRVNEKAMKNKVEHGQFTVFAPFTDKEEAKITSKDIILERMFYMDFESLDKSIIRIFKNRKNINLIEVECGRKAENIGEILIEKRYSEEHELLVGDEISIGNTSLKIVGIGSVPDYDAVYKNFSDTSVDSMQFGLGFAVDEQYEDLKHKGSFIKSEEYTYAYRLKGTVTNEELRDYIKEFNLYPNQIEDIYFQEYWNNINGEVNEIEKELLKLGKGMEEIKSNIEIIMNKHFDTNIRNLKQFVVASENPRIEASSDEQVINKYTGLAAGIIVMILLTYVISVFVIYSIEKESSVIGTLYALGIKKRNLMINYLALPVCITLVGGIIGTLLGFSKYGLQVQIESSYNYFSIPKLQGVYAWYLIVYGIIMPPVIAAIVNCLVINKRLSKSALQLIRKEKNHKVMDVNLKKLGFIGSFRIRQIIREMRSVFTVMLGMFISLLIMMLGIQAYVICNNLSIENKEDTKYEYMYTYKYPESKIPAGGEEAYGKTLSKEIYGYELDVTLLGIHNNNPYFNVSLEKGKNKVVISSSVADKYHLKEGDKLILTDKEENMDYAFTICGVTQYSVGLHVFMDIESMRELFDESDDYYNILFSSEDLEIEPGRLYAITSKEDISKGSEVFKRQMIPMIIMLTVISSIIFCVVMYLMINVMISRSSTSISLLKIFGYKDREVRKLYLDMNFYIIAVGAMIIIPLAKKIMDSIYPLLISNVACGMNGEFSLKLYIGIYAFVILLYVFINWLLINTLKKIEPIEVLKDRE